MTCACGDVVHHHGGCGCIQHPLFQEPMVEGGNLNLKWTDCGDSSYHAKVKALSPTILPIGQKTTITGSGNVDEQVTGGGFTITAKFGVTEHYSGDVCSSKVIKLPMGVGTITWEGLKCPVAKGKVSVAVDVQLSRLIPARLAKGTIQIKAAGASNDNLICLDIDTSAAAQDLSLGDPNGFLHEMGSKKYRCGTEGHDSTRVSMQKKFESACKKEKCSTNERAIVIAMASQESDKMDKSDTSKGTSSGKSNWSPFNMNMDQLSYLGCDSTCAKSLVQSASKYDIDKAVHYLVKGIRGGTKIGGTCDFFNFHRDGTTGWKTCKGKSCKCDCGHGGCEAYKDALADAAHQILDHKDFTGGKRYCEKVPHIR